MSLPLDLDERVEELEKKIRRLERASYERETNGQEKERLGGGGKYIRVLALPGVYQDEQGIFAIRKDGSCQRVSVLGNRVTYDGIDGNRVTYDGIDGTKLTSDWDDAIRAAQLISQQ